MATCPECKQPFTFEVVEPRILNETRFPVALAVKHCGKPLCVFVDASFKVIGAHPLYTIDSEEQREEAGSRAPDAIEKGSYSDKREAYIEKRSVNRTFYSPGVGIEVLDQMEIPNALEEQLLRAIFEAKHVSLDDLYKQAKPLGEELKVPVHPDMIVTRLEKYVGKRIIKVFFG
ncbi:MAG: hypothetical protein JW839_00995 [Candidatus Lokiarchaeota archaeon]|nr:hypothetical protein [Candidatus Lokiarchaeota archaeon]